MWLVFAAAVWLRSMPTPRDPRVYFLWGRVKAPYIFASGPSLEIPGISQLLQKLRIMELRRNHDEPEGHMKTKDTKNASVAGSARPMIPPKNIVRVASESDRRTVVTAARAVIKEHRDVIKALAKR